MGHCVAAYVDDVASQQFILFSLQAGHGPRSTIAFVRDGKTFRLHQHHGRYNETVRDPALLATASWLEQRLNDSNVE